MKNEQEPVAPATLTMRPIESEHGTKGWYIDGPDFYCDIEREHGKQYSIFIRHKDGTEGFAEMSQPVPPILPNSTELNVKPAFTFPDGQEPIAYVTGYYSGRCVIEPINRAMVMPQNMALYAGPQPEQTECCHDETERLGAVWTCCTQCGKKWEDKQGPKGCSRSHPHENMDAKCEAKTIVARKNYRAVVIAASKLADQGGAK